MRVTRAPHNTPSPCRPLTAPPHGVSRAGARFNDDRRHSIFLCGWRRHLTQATRVFRELSQRRQPIKIESCTSTAHAGCDVKPTACDADMRLSYCPVYCACSCHVVPDVRAAAVMWQPGAPLVLLLLLHGWIVGAENLSTKLADRCANQACTRLCAHARSTWHLAFDRGAHHPVGVCAGIGKHAI